MQNHFLKEKIESGFEEEKELLEHEPDKKAKVPFLFYVRPIYFTILIAATLTALALNGYKALEFFLSH